MSDEVYLIDGARTPQGRYGGGLASVRPDDLAALVVGEAVRRAGIPADAVDEVILGAANQAGEDNRDVARMAVLLAGLPHTVPGYTVNRLCASGLTALAGAAQAIRAILFASAREPAEKVDGSTTSGPRPKDDPICRTITDISNRWT